MIKAASCPQHGRAQLVNAGAPYLVRCVAGGNCSTLERCDSCRGVGCLDCAHTGWRQRWGPLGSKEQVW